MVKGKPYISVKSATRKAENAPNERQSRAVRGREKLNAKMMNTPALMITSGQRPYAGTSLFIAVLPLVVAPVSACQPQQSAHLVDAAHWVLPGLHDHCAYLAS